MDMYATDIIFIKIHKSTQNLEEEKKKQLEKPNTIC